jgi:hypothetical protein
MNVFIFSDLHKQNYKVAVNYLKIPSDHFLKNLLQLQRYLIFQNYARLNQAKICNL